jgi:integrase
MRERKKGVRITLDESRIIKSNFDLDTGGSGVRSSTSSSSANIMAATTTGSKSKKPFWLEADLQHVLDKCKSSGLDLVADFLQTKARRSVKTALTFWNSLVYLNDYTKARYGLDLQNIVLAIHENKVDVYSLVNSFITYLQKETVNGSELQPRTIILYVAAVKSFFVYADVDISSAKFRHRVSLPPLYKEDEQAIDSSDIKEILNHCDNKRLKAYLLVLASGGMRALEALAIRECDIDWGNINFEDPSDKSEPAPVRIRKEYAKTKKERRIFISNEAARYLNEWLIWKYRNQTGAASRANNKNDLVFSRVRLTNRHPLGLYSKMAKHFRYTLLKAGYGSRKQDGVWRRRNVTLHSFRRFVKTTIANQTRNSDYSEWFLGHTKSSYYTNKPEELKRIYKEDCMKYLTFLDYPTVEATGRSFEAKLKEKDKEIEALKQQIRQVNETKELELQELRTKTEKLDALQEQIDRLNKKLGLA